MPKRKKPAVTQASNTSKQPIQNKRRQRIILCLAAVTTVCAVVLAFFVVPHVADLRELRREQANLPNISPFDAHWLEINPDFVGWLRIDGTIIDFPVVRGSDNVRYLNTTFRGAENRAGAIFMDYRNVCVEMPHILIYGHEVRDENNNWLMFGPLHYFLDEEHRAAHPLIVFMENDYMHEFEIFAARQTTVRDPAFRINFNAEGAFEIFLERNGAPPDATRIITLSTCIGVDNDRRMIVQGALRRSIPVVTEYGEAGWNIITRSE